ncbi:RdgB/HAM1 family non-canonical purine NTP pyrophosphatase [Methylophilaceae bacterium]|nr:RdgB/HAM1 family non-canonical purine NTP pyrophosphatase [Methylophilaceae bacterium]
MNKIVIATNNEKKLNEISAILEDLNIQATPQSHFKIGESEEPFDTFIENALIKARYASKKTGLPAIADDSGLCVDILKGEPGIYSARFSGSPRSDENNNLKLLDLLKDQYNRKAHYYCAIVFIKSSDDPQPVIAEGIWQGEILKIPRGKNGFGYDPLFLDYKTDLSAAELSTELKNKISHRGQALQKIKQKLKMIYGQ